MENSDGSIAWLERFLTGWHGPRPPGAGPAESDVPVFLPAALARLHRFAGYWPGRDPEQHLPDSSGILQQQDVLVRVGDLDVRDGMVEFMRENQDSWSCRVAAVGESAPAVWSNAHWMWDDDADPGDYVALTPTLEHLLTTFVLQETLFGCENLATIDDLSPLPDERAPLWLDGWYVFEEPSHSFWFVGAALVAEISGTRWVGWKADDAPPIGLGELRTVRESPRTSPRGGAGR